VFCARGRGTVIAIATVLCGCAGAPAAEPPGAPASSASASQPSNLATAQASEVGAAAPAPPPPPNPQRTDKLCSRDAWCWVGPQPRGGAVRAFWGSGPKDVYAIAGEHILHYDGERWAGQQAANHELLTDLWGTGPLDVWAVGAAGTLLRYDGQAWRRVGDFGGKTLTGVWGSGVSDVYVVAYDATLYHYDGVTFRDRGRLPTQQVTGVFGRSATEVYVMGSDLLRFDGKSWSVQQDRNVSRSGSLRCDHMSISADGTLYAVSAPMGVVKHEGGHWIRLPAPFPSPRSDQPEAAWAATDDAVFAVGHNGWLGRYDGQSWQTWRTGVRFRNMEAVWGTSPTDVFAGGRAGEIQHYDGKEWSLQTRGVIEPSYTVTGAEDGSVAVFGAFGKGGRYDGKGGFEPLDVEGFAEPPHWNFYFGRDAAFIGGELYVVHTHGWLLKRGAGGWDTVWEHEKAKARVLWGSSLDDLYLGTNQGLFHFDGQAWSQDRRLGARDLCRVLATKDGELQVRTCKGVVYRKRRGGWQRWLSRPKRIERLFLTHSGELFGRSKRVDKDGRHQAYELQRLQGGRWTRVWESKWRPVRGVWSPTKDEVWAVAKQSVVHYDGQAWTEQATDGALPCHGGPELERVTGTADHVYVVGIGGALLRKRRR